MKYLIAVLPSREQAEAAANALREANFSRDDISIMGEGFDTTEGLGIVEAPAQARIRARQVSYWLMSFGFVGAFAFNWLNGIEIIPNAVGLINHTLAGFIGLLVGALVSAIIGGPLGWTNSGDALSLRNRLDAGKYIVALRGDASKMNSAATALKRFQPEVVQAYAVPATRPENWTNRQTTLQQAD